METMESLLSPRKHEYLALGLMSGTSADGVTGALVRFVIQEEHFEDQILEFITVPYPKDLRQKIFRLFRDEAGSLRLVCELNFEIGQFFGKVAQRVIFNSGIPKDAIHVIGSHGQTVYHLPPGQKELKKYAPSTLQIGEASVISQMTGVPVASDFRTADIAAGGHGAPLIAAADFYLLRHGSKTRIIQNLGGIGNCTYLPAGAGLEKVIAFDTGPANMAVDSLVFHLTGGKETYDRDGKRAASGKVNEKWLKSLLSHQYYSKKPPKTTGREMFGEPYALELLREGKKRRLAPNDIIATASMLTVESIILAYEKFCFPLGMPKEVILGGGGAKYRFIVNALKNRLPSEIKVMTHESLGINSMAKEAIGFALLGLLCALGRPGNVPAATGAKKSVILGKLYYPDLILREE